MPDQKNRKKLPGNPSRLKWRKCILVGSLIVPLGSAVLFVYSFLASDRTLHEAIAEADRLDPGWRMQELQAKRASIPDQENTARALQAAYYLLPPNWPFWDFPGAPENKNRSYDEYQILSVGRVAPPVRLTTYESKALREELRRAGKALAVARQLANLPQGRDLPLNQAWRFKSCFLMICCCERKRETRMVR
jgi:hypothetical protein